LPSELDGKAWEGNRQNRQTLTGKPTDQLIGQLKKMLHCCGPDCGVGVGGGAKHSSMQVHGRMEHAAIQQRGARQQHIRISFAAFGEQSMPPLSAVVLDSPFNATEPQTMPTTHLLDRYPQAVSQPAVSS